MIPVDELPDPDIEALREKYLQERDKRLRADHEDQYLETAGEFAHFYQDDPWTPPFEREPIAEEIDLAILGGGFAGLLAGGRAREQGIEDLRIIEMGGDFGGTWYWNRYPGVQCDIESYCYLPLLDETGYMPKEKYSYGQEIYEHCQRIAKHYDLYDSALFQTRVESLVWDEAIKRWHVRTDRGDDIRARFVIMGTGSYNRPKLPDIPGIAGFKGRIFHTARWDYEYTGGDANGGLDKLADKSVAIIGTGATGVQAVPFLGEHCKQLYVIQRTPSVVDVRGNRPTDPDWAKSLKPGWAHERRAKFAACLIGAKWDVDPVADGWTVIQHRVRARTTEGMSAKDLLDLTEIEDYRHMQELRDRVDEIVTEDPEAAEALKAWYRWLCKRPCFNDNFLPTFNRPNVSLIDVSATKGVQRITETGFVANDREYPVDCIILASGFEVTTSMDRRLGISPFEGRDGLSLYDKWRDGFQTFHGHSSYGFPNLFWTGYTQGAKSVNVTSMYEDQLRHIAWIIGEALRRGAVTIEAREDYERDWVRIVHENPYDNSVFLTECTPGFYNNEGGPVRRSHMGESYGPGLNAFNALLADWRVQGDLEGMVLTPSEEAP